MTQPVEDIEKLAERIAVKICRESVVRKKGIQSISLEHIIASELRIHFAARDADLQRLRELLQESVTHLETRANHARYMADKSKWQADQDAYTNIANATCGLLTKIEAALQPNHQEPSDGSS